MAADERAAAPDDAVESRILDYLRRELVSPEVKLATDLDLLAGGILDSMGVLRLATYLGEQFEIEIQPGDFVIENFSSVAAVAAYVGRARARTGEADGPARP